MKAIIFGLLISTTTFASELSPRILEVIGNYESKGASNTSHYTVDDFSSFNVSITPDSEAILYFAEWDIDLNLDRELNFSGSISECEDPGCSGISEIEGKILFKLVDGKETPYAKLTMYFFEDTSEDIDCDEVDCDNLDYDDYWKEWEESFEYEFEGVSQSHLPAFKPASVNAELATNLEECKNVIKGTFLKCATASHFKFEQEINAESLEKLNDYLGTSFKTKLSKADALQLLGTQIHNLLLQAKFYTFAGVETAEYLALEANLNKLVELVSHTDVDSVVSNLSRSVHWRSNASIDFLLINKANLAVTRLKLEF